MPDRALDGRRVLAIQDEPIIADALGDASRAAGADVLGPVPSVQGRSIAWSARCPTPWCWT